MTRLTGAALRRACVSLIAPGIVIAGAFAAAIWLRRTRDVAAPEAWSWPMMLALLVSPVIYQWYLIWLIPFAMGRRAIPVWTWTLSVLVIYPTWHLRSLGEPFSVPPALLFLEFAVPAAAVAWLFARRAPSVRPAETAVHG